MMERKDYLAWGGAVLLGPAILTCLSGILDLSPDNPFLHPVAVLGGLASAIALNLLPVASWRAQQEAGRLVGGVVTFRVKDRLANLFVVALSLALAAVIFAYLYLENVRPH